VEVILERAAPGAVPNRETSSGVHLGRWTKITVEAEPHPGMRPEDVTYGSMRTRRATVSKIWVTPPAVAFAPFLRERYGVDVVTSWRITDRELVGT
jgi:hypothetical protein